MKIIGTFGLVVTVSIALLQPAQGRPYGGGARSFSPGYHSSSAGHFAGRPAGFSRGGGGGYYRGGGGYYRGGGSYYRSGGYNRGGVNSPRAASAAAYRNRAYATAGSRNVATVNRATALRPRAYSTSGGRLSTAGRAAVPAQAGGGNWGRASASVPTNVTNSWNRNCDHVWNGHHCRWYNNAWIIIDPWWGYYPWGYGYYGYGYPYGGYYGDPYYYDDSYANGYSEYDNGYGDPNVRDVQAALARKGYYHGALDGSFGPATRGAVRQYQVNHGLEVTGRLDGPVIAKLGLR